MIKKLKKINIIDVDLEPNIWIHGDGDSVCFTRTNDGTEKDTGFELTWGEIYKACREYKEAR